MLYVLFFIVSGCFTKESKMSSEEDYMLGSDLKEHDDASDHLSGDDNDNDFFELQDTNTDTVDDEFSCQVITRDSLLAAQTDDLQTATELLMVGESHARTLLIHYRWDVEKLGTVLVEKGKDHLFAEAGVKMVVQGHDLGTCSSSSSIAFCDVCCGENVQCDEATKMDCQHTYCNNCWTKHFVEQIEGHCRRITCMAYKCNTVCDEFVIRKLISKKNQGLVKKFDRVLLESYIEENKMVKWCPSVPHCGNAIRVHSGVLSEVRCKCGYKFCFNCLSEAHSPCSCLMWDLWNKKQKDESSSSINWIAVNTKKCPSCYKPVQKDGGCNIISCVCRKRFCWVCLEAVIGHHKCSHSHDVTYVDPAYEVESERKILCRYMHYYKRFNAHRHSLELRTTLEKIVRERISSSEKQTGLQDFRWLEKGMCRLFRSRRILSCSYAFSYYMFGDELFKDYMSKEVRIIKQNLFEYQLHELEGNVEKLSRLFEEPFDDIIGMKSKVNILCNVVGKLCENIYDCIENDLLGCLPCNDHDIAPYRSDHVERAYVLSDML